MNSMFSHTAVATVDATAVSLGTLLQVADLEALTGALCVGEAGQIHLRSGLPTDARCGVLTGLDAFYELFIEAPTASDLRLVRGATTADAWGRRPLASLILEGTRRADEWSRVWRHVVRLRDGSPAAPPDDTHADFVAALLLEMPVAEAAEASAMPRHVAACLVSQWLDQAQADVIATVAASVPTRPRGSDPVESPARDRAGAEPTVVAPSSDPTTFYEQLDQGRRALRAGDLRAAYLAFEAATVARPEDRVARQNLRRVESLMGASS